MQPATTFVLTSAPAQQRKTKRDTILVCTWQGVTASLLLVNFTILAPGPTCPVVLEYTAVTLVLAGMTVQLRTYGIVRSMGRLQLLLTPEGVIYTSSAATFSALWSVVKRAKLRGHPDGIEAATSHVIVHVPGWGGPVAEFPVFNRLTIHLEHTGSPRTRLPGPCTGSAVAGTRQSSDWLRHGDADWSAPEEP